MERPAAPEAMKGPYPCRWCGKVLTDAASWFQIAYTDPVVNAIFGVDVCSATCCDHVEGFYKDAGFRILSRRPRSGREP